MVEQGAAIYEDGSISMPSPSEPVATAEPTEAPLTEPISSGNKTAVESSGAQSSTIIIAIVCAVLVVIAIAVIGISKKRSGKEEKK
jgi:hypothetical protein